MSSPFDKKFESAPALDVKQEETCKLDDRVMEDDRKYDDFIMEDGPPAEDLQTKPQDGAVIRPPLAPSAKAIFPKPLTFANSLPKGKSSSADEELPAAPGASLPGACSAGVKHLRFGSIAMQFYEPEGDLLQSTAALVESRRKRFKTYSSDHIADLLGDLLEHVCQQSGTISDQSAAIARLNDQVRDLQERCKTSGTSAKEIAGSSKDAVHSSKASGPVYAVPSRQSMPHGKCTLCQWDWNAGHASPMDPNSWKQLMETVYENWDQKKDGNQYCEEKESWPNKPWDTSYSLYQCKAILDYETFAETLLHIFWSPSTSPSNWLFVYKGGGKTKYVVLGCIRCQRYESISYSKDGDNHNVRNRLEAVLGKIPAGKTK